MDARVRDGRAADVRDSSGGATRYVSILPDEVELVELSHARPGQPRGWLFAVGVTAVASAVVIGLLSVGAISIGPRSDKDGSVASAAAAPVASTPSAPIADTAVSAQAPLGAITAAILATSPPSEVTASPTEDVAEPGMSSGEAQAASFGRASGWTSLQDTAIAYYLSPEGSQCAILTLAWVAERVPGGELSFSQHLDVQLSDPTCQPSETRAGVDLDASHYRIVGLADAYVETSLEVAGHAVAVDVAWTGVGAPEIYSDRWAGDTWVITRDVTARLTGTVAVDGTPWRPDQAAALLRSGTFTAFSPAPVPAPPDDAQPSPSVVPEIASPPSPGS